MTAETGSEARSISPCEDAAARVLIRRDLVIHDTLADPDAPEDLRC
ncbi:MAG: hypothetical protein ACYDEN_04160 [Acidimicrobiales bacterium]